MIFSYQYGGSLDQQFELSLSCVTWGRWKQGMNCDSRLLEQVLDIFQMNCGAGVLNFDD